MIKTLWILYLFNMQGGIVQYPQYLETEQRCVEIGKLPGTKYENAEMNNRYIGFLRYSCVPIKVEDNK